MTAPLLHDYWRSSASYRVRIALNLKGIAYDAVSVDLVAGAQTAEEHLARNPQGLVPVLEIDAKALSQSLAILEYLEETRPEPPLLPGSPAERARVRTVAMAIAMEIHPICNLKVVNHVVALRNGDEAAKQAWMQHWITPGLDAVECLLDDPATGSFCHGEQPGLADCCLIPQLYNARRWGLEVASWPRIAMIEAACADQEPFRAAHPDSVGPVSPDL